MHMHSHTSCLCPYNKNIHISSISYVPGMLLKILHMWILLTLPLYGYRVLISHPINKTRLRESFCKYSLSTCTKILKPVFIKFFYFQSSGYTKRKDFVVKCLHFRLHLGCIWYIWLLKFLNASSNCNCFFKCDISRVIMDVLCKKIISL